MKAAQATWIDNAAIAQFPRIVQPTITVSPITAAGHYVPALLPEVGRWLPANDRNIDARHLFHRHESGIGNSRNIGGTGDKLILVTPQADALIMFRKLNGIGPFDSGVQCVAFRNEGHFRSCSLIREAVEQWAWPRWPGERLFAHFSGQRIVATNPGYAFKCAGWRRCGLTATELIALELLSR